MMLEIAGRRSARSPELSRPPPPAVEPSGEGYIKQARGVLIIEHFALVIVKAIMCRIFTVCVI